MTPAPGTGDTWGDMLDWIESGPDGFPGPTHSIRVEDFEENGTYVLRAEMPGIDPDKDVEVGVSGDVLTISGRRQQVERDKSHSEFRYGSFRRSLRLPPGSDRGAMTATYENGVLEVRVPVGEGRGDVTQVPVQRASS